MASGRLVATLSLDAIDRLGLAVGSPLTGMEERIADEVATLRVYDRALATLAARARASNELARLLVRKGEPPHLVERAVCRLRDQGLLDDAAFARAFVRSRVLGSRQSRRRVEQELARRGVARDIIQAAVATVFAEEGVDQEAIAVDAARRKMRSLARLEPAVRRRRLYGFLSRRGYDGDDIRRAMSAVGEELAGEDAG